MIAIFTHPAEDCELDEPRILEPGERITHFVSSAPGAEGVQRCCRCRKVLKEAGPCQWPDGIDLQERRFADGGTVWTVVSEA